MEGICKLEIHYDLSVGQRDSIVELVRGGHSYRQVASMLKIPKTTLYNVFERYDSRGTTENAKKSGRRNSLDDRHGRKIL
jgi:transposase